MLSYLTRRLVDVAHDVIINEEDCGTLRGLECREIKNNEGGCGFSQRENPRSCVGA